jgi:hypothetical protein
MLVLIGANARLKICVPRLRSGAEDMLEDRMRRSPFDSRLSATMVVLLANVVAFLLECVLYGYPRCFLAAATSL